MNFSNFDLNNRLSRLKSMSLQDRQSTVQRLTQCLPQQYLPWPYGMPLSADSSVVIVGASPGNSPDPAEKTKNSDYDGPTFGKAHPGFFYDDTKSYWQKVCSLCSAVVQVANPNLAEEDALALSGHLNLGTGQSGTATDAVVNDQILAWVSNLLGSVLSADVVITFGINGILTKHKYNSAWNEVPGALKLNWKNPHKVYPFQNYSFRVWDMKRSDGRSVMVCMWPNHPSRHPFTGTADGSLWKESLAAFQAILQSHVSAA